MKDKLNPTSPILAVDDEEKILRSVRVTLRAAGFNNIVICQDSRQAMDLIAEHKVEIVLLDLTMPHIGGEELLGMINVSFPEIPVVIITGSVDVDTAVRCMKTGAFDYVIKPVEEGRLLSAVSRGLDFRELKRENLSLRQHMLSDALERPEAFSAMITKNKTMLSIFQYIESIAHSSQPVMITGETGTGKELMARSIHNCSKRTGEYVAVNVAGLDDNVFTDTLFGHAKGAFTGADTTRAGLVEKAAGGTLMLDEIGDISAASQAKLLRFLQESEYLPLGVDRPKRADVRVLTATNRDIKELLGTGRFRKDLVYRLRTHDIHIPPLRERKDDIPLLLDHFLGSAAVDLGKNKPTPPPELLTLLKTYSFPGNVRELQAMVHDAVSQHKSGVLSLKVFKSKIARECGEGFELKQPEMAGTTPLAFSEDLPTLREASRLLIDEAMKRAGGNQSVAAVFLGISQQALSKRLQQYSQIDEE